jgi:hypothetical protein
MPRIQGTQVQNNFMQGLITETTALKFPENACSDALNVVFDETGRVTRRKGFDLESNYTLLNVEKEEAEAFTEFLWTNVSGLGNVSFLVQQRGSTIYFYNLSVSTNVSANKHVFELDLFNYLPIGTTNSPESYECDFAQGNGDLFIANPICNTIVVSYNADDDEFVADVIEIAVRDTSGLQDGLEDAERPSSSVSDLKTGNPQHYYNLLNQGWFSGDALSQWDTARSDLPSNSDTVPLYRASATDAFNDAIVTSKSPGNALAAKGHFILSATNPNRNAALEIEGFTGVADLSQPSTYLLNPSVGALIGDYNSTSTTFFGVRLLHWTSSTSTGYWGKDFGLNPKRIYSMLASSDDDGFVIGANPSMTITLYAKNGSPPSSGTDGTQLATVSFTDSASLQNRTLVSNDNVTPYRYVWLYYTQNGSSSAEVRMVRGVDTASGGLIRSVNDGVAQISTNFRPSQIEFYAGRAWYAGINDASLSNSIFFSQIVERKDQYSRCYQANDPTAEDFFDLLSSDGGVIRIPEMDKVTKLYAYQTTLIVFATNGIWLISGAAGSPFKANDYQVKKVGSIGTSSSLSFVDIKGNPVWWAEDGLYTMQYDPNYDSFTPKSITDQTIKSFILKIPAFNRKYVKGAYDPSTDQAIWLFNDQENLETNNYYRYRKMLVLNTLSNAFYPWEVGESDETIRGLVYVYSSDRAAEDMMKYVVTTDIDSSNQKMTFADQDTQVWYDWSSSTETDYESYFVTGYTYPSQPDKFFQGNYIQVFLDTEDMASCRMQGLWDWANSGNSGKWSSLQQIYNNLLVYHDINYRKLKLRGKGKTLQLRFESESGRPFSIIGWTTWITGNSAV